MNGNETTAAVAVKACGVERRFSHMRVLRGLDLELERGRTLSIFGSNGAGKTTFLNILAGLLRPDRGSVELFGETLPGSAELRRRIGVVGHEAFVYGDMSAYENLEYYSRLYKVEKTGRVEAILDEVGLRAAAKRPARTYSRGMLQRLALARAVLHEPELLLLDEPFTGLDPVGARLLSTLIGGLHEQGVTIILTVHDFERGLEVADDVVVLHRGRVGWRSAQELPDTAQMSEIYESTVGA